MHLPSFRRNEEQEREEDAGNSQGVSQQVCRDCLIKQSGARGVVGSHSDLIWHGTDGRDHHQHPPMPN